MLYFVHSDFVCSTNRKTHFITINGRVTTIQKNSQWIDHECSYSQMPWIKSLAMNKNERRVKKCASVTRKEKPHDIITPRTQKRRTKILGYNIKTLSYSIEDKLRNGFTIDWILRVPPTSFSNSFLSILFSISILLKFFFALAGFFSVWVISIFFLFYS